MYKLALLCVYYFFYSALGWLAESIYCSLGEQKWINRGFLTGPLCPIYGTGALVMTVFLIPLKDFPVQVNMFGTIISITPLLVFIAGMVLADIVEFITSLTMEKLFHARWWDYSEKPFNIQGRICLQHTFYWGIASIVFVYLVHPFFSRYAEKIFPIEKPNILYTVLIVILFIFVLDIINAVRNAMDVKKVMDKVRKLNDSITRVANEIKSNVEVRFDELQASALKRAERFAVWRGDIAGQMSEIVETFGFTVRVKNTGKKNSSDKVNRLINGYPNFRRIAKKQLNSFEELLAEIKKRITDNEEEMY